ncbi:MAG: hypothetical protein LOD89_07890 [Tissierellales bacterium]
MVKWDAFISHKDIKKEFSKVNAETIEKAIYGGRIGDSLLILCVTDKGNKILYRLDKKYHSKIYGNTSHFDKGPYIIKDSCELVYNLREAIV